MTREEIMTLGLDELEERRAAIATETDEADDATLDALTAEIEIIEERTKALNLEIEERAKAAKAVAEGAGKTIDTRKDEHKMTDMEIRNSHDYIEAFAKYVKTGNASECRALLSDNVNGGVVPVPTFVGGIVAKRLEESEILRRVRRMNAAGNVKVGFELNAPAAGVHTEGSDTPMPEEELVLGIVELIPQTYKKWVSISDEALDSMSGEDYLSYIYDEVARGIIKAEENAVINAILTAPQNSTSAPNVAEFTVDSEAISDFVQARALLSSAAEDLVIIAKPADYAAYRALQMGANYGVDPFDGLEVLFSDAATSPIIGDLSGVMMNLPKGEAIEFKYDDKTYMTSDMVRVLGRQPAAIGVVGNLYFAKLVEGTI
jgi:HK97 family phage major capsid protein